jgi:hypothetical protein
MRAEDLLRRLQDRPFKPFQVHLSDGSVFAVSEPEMVIVGRSSAVLPSRFGQDTEGRRLAEDWRTVSLVHIVQFSDVNGDGGNGNGQV